VEQWRVGRTRGFEPASGSVGTSSPKSPSTPAGSPVTTLLESNGRTFGIFYLAGAGVGLAALVLPHSTSFNAAAAVTLSACAAVIGAWSWRHRYFGPVVTNLMVAGGTVCVSAGVYSGRGDDVSMSAAVIYIWLALAAGLFTTGRAVAGQVVLIGASYATVLALSGNHAAPAEWLIVAVTAAVSAAITFYCRTALVRLSQTDALTGLLNRAGLYGVIRRQIAESHRTHSPLSLAIFDLDGFKSLNDAQGHLAGDAALVETTRSWERELRTTDVLARFGGDEFVVVLPDTTALQASRVVQRMARLETACGSSAGLACWDGSEGVEQFLDRADRALYEAKARQRAHSVSVARPRRTRLTGVIATPGWGSEAVGAWSPIEML